MSGRTVNSTLAEPDAELEDSLWAELASAKVVSCAAEVASLDEGGGGGKVISSVEGCCVSVSVVSVEDFSTFVGFSVQKNIGRDVKMVGIIPISH